jgi:stress-induced morphogen
VTRQERIEKALAAAFNPQHLAVENESHQHSVKPGSETHFKVLLVSETFAELDRIARHRRVHAELASELASGLHALSLRALTPAEWAAQGREGFVSPPCLGGSKAEAAARKG